MNAKETPPGRAWRSNDGGKNMRTWKYTLAAALTAACCLLPLAGLAESYGVIRGGRLNLRAEPHAGSDRLGQ